MFAPMMVRRVHVLAVLACAAGVDCQDQLPPGLSPLVVKVADALTTAPLCDAQVTINGQPAQEGSPNTIGCYYVSSVDLAVGSTYTASASHPGYVTVTTTGTIASTSSSVTLILDRVDGGFTDASADAPQDVTSDVATDALDASADGDSD